VLCGWCWVVGVLRPPVTGVWVAGADVLISYCAVWLGRVVHVRGFGYCFRGVAALAD